MSKRNKGIIFMIASSVFLAFMAAGVRAAGGIPTMEKLFFRNIVGMITSAIVIWRSRGSFWGNDKRSLILRAVMGFIALSLYFFAIDRLPLANAVILNQIYPFFTLVMAFLYLQEKIIKTQWIALALAIGGVVFIVRPGAGYTFLPALAGLLSAVFIAAAYIVVRYLRLTDTPQTIIFYLTGFTTLATIPFMVFGSYVHPNPRQLIILLSIGVTATIGQFLLTYAYRYCEAGDISIYAYGNTVTALFLGIIIWGEIPDLFNLVGVALILCGAYLNYYSKANQTGMED